MVEDNEKGFLKIVSFFIVVLQILKMVIELCGV